jgi:carbonic anhydrase
VNPISFNYKFPPLQNLKYDIPASIAVFFVAVPLCLGIAHASGAPLFSGLITGIVGGILVGFLSSSNLSVSGPAAGLTAIAISGIQNLGSFEGFLTATFLAGLIQLTLGFLRAGSVASYIPNTVIKGMLSAIGLILILKEFPHMIGYDVEAMGVEEFNITREDVSDGYQNSGVAGSNSLTLFFNSLLHINKGVLLIGLASFISMTVWEKLYHKRFKLVPGALLVVMAGMLVQFIYERFSGEATLTADHFVNIPDLGSMAAISNVFIRPDFSVFNQYGLYVTAFTVAAVASIETLLSTEAIEKLDPAHQITNPNQELVAQGIGNTLSGLLGGLPMTAVIVRGSVNVNSGARSKYSTIIHGFLIAVAILFFAFLMNKIPLASLAAILVFTGLKLLNPSMFMKEYRLGWSQFIPFIVTLLAIVFTDLLIGVIIGLVVAFIAISMEDYQATIFRVVDTGTRKRVILGDNVNFLYKPKLIKVLRSVEPGTTLEIDGSNNRYIDRDIIEIIQEFKEASGQRNINVIIGGIKTMDNNNKDFHEEMQESYDKLFKNNRKWIAEKLDEDPNYFKSRAGGQTPKYLFIGCSDSRVPANEITGTEAGEMFVQRNIANMVVHTDVNLMSVLQYSVEVLNVKHVIVCGHYGCGGVRAAMEDQAHGLIDKWLRNIKDVVRLHKAELDAIEDHELKHRRLVELNVREQVLNLFKTSYIQKNIQAYGFPQVHGWVYDINDGKLIDLKIDVKKEFPDFDDVYKLY